MAMRSPTWRTLSMTPDNTSGRPRSPVDTLSPPRRLLRCERRAAWRRAKKPPAPTLTEISTMISMVRMVCI